MMITRRRFSQIAVSGLASAAWAARPKTPIGVQLYSIRQIAAKDLPAVLAEVAKLGYQGVEFAGYYDHSAQEIRKLLDDNRLKVAGTHTGLETMLGENLAKTIEFNRTIGNKNLIVPGLGGKYTSSIAAWKDTAKIFSELAAKVKPMGFDVGYHNHAGEFRLIEGESPFDAFFGSTTNDVKMQLDIGHARRAGADPVALIKKYKGRVISVHVKEYAPNNPDVALGDGVVDWKSVFSELESQGKTEWYVVEEESKSCKEYDCVQRSIERLRKMGK